MPPVVNSHDEWSPLEEVIVGVPYDLDYRNDESFRRFFASLTDDPQGFRQKIPDRLKEETLEDLDGFVKLLESFGVTVRRPQALTAVPEISTPNWSAPLGHPLMPRDLFMVIGDQIIETTPSARSRYLEGELYTELFTGYFNQGARWAVAPRSRLLDGNFDFSYVISDDGREGGGAGRFLEIMFDGSQVLRLGRDLVFNASNENHRMGARWLARHLGEQYRVHLVSLTVTITDNHIDNMLVPLRPGTLLCREIVDRQRLPRALQRWDVVWHEWSDEPLAAEEDGVPFPAWQSTGVNVLSLDSEHVVVQDFQTGLMRDLEKAGFTPVPCRWRHGRGLGGGFHCLTLDVRRRGAREAYL